MITVDPSPRPRRRRVARACSGRRAGRAINEYLHDIGITATAHQLRHWCATNAYNATRDLRGVQELLGHSPATTAIYAALDVERLRSIVDSIEVPVA